MWHVFDCRHAPTIFLCPKTLMPPSPTITCTPPHHKEFCSCSLISLLASPVIVLLLLLPLNDCALCPSSSQPASTKSGSRQHQISMQARAQVRCDTSSSSSTSCSSSRPTALLWQPALPARPCRSSRRSVRMQATAAPPEGGLSYKAAGVDIDAGDELVRRIQKLNPSIGGFSGLVPFGDSYLVAGTDGVGTKLKLAFDMNKHDTVGIDLVAMSVNDIITSGAQPLFFLDYYATGFLDVDTAEQVWGGRRGGGAGWGCGQTSMIEKALLRLGRLTRSCLPPTRQRAGWQQGGSTQQAAVQTARQFNPPSSPVPPCLPCVCVCVR